MARTARVTQRVSCAAHPIGAHRRLIARNAPRHRFELDHPSCGSSGSLRPNATSRSSPPASFLNASVLISVGSMSAWGAGRSRSSRRAEARERLGRKLAVRAGEKQRWGSMLRLSMDPRKEQGEAKEPSGDQWPPEIFRSIRHHPHVGRQRGASRRGGPVDEIATGLVPQRGPHG